MLMPNVNAASATVIESATAPHRQSTENQDARIRFANHDDPLLNSRMGVLSLVGEATIAALKARVEFVDKLIDFIVDKQWSTQRPLTLISFGAGALLTEHMVHEGLLKQGFSQLRWRLIDTAYVNGGLLEHRANFIHGKADARAFTTEAAYFGKKVGQCQMANADKADGAVIVLIIESQASIPTSSDLINAEPGYMPIQCIPIPDIKKANCIYLVADAPGKRDLAEMPAMLRAGKVAIALPDAVRCFIDYAASNIYIKASDSANGKYMHEKIESALLEKASSLPTLAQFDKIVQGAAKAMAQSESHPLTLMQFSSFDNAIGLFRLERHFDGGDNPVLFAALENNHTVLAMP